MKRKLRIALIVVLALAVSTASAFATTVDVWFNKINIEADGGLKAVTGEYFVRSTGDIPFSILYEGTTYLPVAKMCEIVGKKIGWDGNTRTVTIEDYDKPVAGAPDSTAEPKPFEKVTLEVGKGEGVVFDSLNIVAYGQTFARPGTMFDRGGGQMVHYSLLYKGTTYLPLAAVCQIVGKDISWEKDTFTAVVNPLKALAKYPGTEVTDFGALCGLQKSADSDEDDILVYNYYDYTSHSGKEAEDLQKYVSYLFDAGFTFSLEDSRQLIGKEDTTLYAYKNQKTGRIVVVGLVQSEGLSQVAVCYTK